jgi:pSer/pThr/pTyr-binding forkhead associated (FHA) protein
VIVLHELDGNYVKTGDVYPLQPLTSLGRAPTNAIRVDDGFASSEHALLALRGGQWWLEDRNSRNGTTLNGVAVNQPVIVTDGDLIGIGKMRFRLEMEP